jgi:DNA replicative helicase MCM subunit Mcm2 (Cdc46/Mcm family)
LAPKKITPQIEKMSTQKLSRTVDPSHRLIYVNAMALALTVAELEARIMAHAQIAYIDMVDPYNFENARSVMNFCTEDLGRQYAAAKSSLALIEASPQFIEARRIIEPLLQAEKEEEERAHRQLNAELQEIAEKRKNLEAKKAKLEQALEQDPEVIAAKARIEELRRKTGHA